MRKVKDKKELLERGWEIRRNWGVGVDEDLTMEERRVRWKLVERAKTERARGMVVVTTNRRIWIDGRAWDGTWREIDGTRKQRRRRRRVMSSRKGREGKEDEEGREWRGVREGEEEEGGRVGTRGRE